MYTYKLLLYLLPVCLSIFVSDAFQFDFKQASDIKKRKLVPSAYMAWVENAQNGLIAQTTQGELDFIFQYRPLDYIILKEARGSNENLTKKIVKQRKQELEGLEYYTFFIALHNGKKDVVKTLSKGEVEYDKMIRYFAGDLQQDLRLVAGSDTVNCKLFHFERTYGITSYAQFVIGFEPSAFLKDADRTLFFDSDKLTTAPILLTIKKEDINNIPEVNF